MDDASLWHEFVEGRQTYSEIGRAHGVSARTVQRRLTEYRPKEPEKEPREVVVLMDTTYWGREYGVMLFKDAVTNENLLKYFVTAETVEKYVQGIAELGRRGYRVLGIVCDGRRGLFNAFPDIPIQMCQFHQQKIVTTRLTRRPKTEAGRELRSLTLMLTKTDRESFEGALYLWHEKWADYLDERTTDAETGKSHYTQAPEVGTLEPQAQSAASVHLSRPHGYRHAKHHQCHRRAFLGAEDQAAGAQRTVAKAEAEVHH